MFSSDVKLGDVLTGFEGSRLEWRLTYNYVSCVKWLGLGQLNMTASIGQPSGNVCTVEVEWGNCLYFA